MNINRENHSQEKPIKEKFQIDSPSKAKDMMGILSNKKKKRMFSILLLAFGVISVVTIAILEFSGDKESAPFAEVLQTWGKNWIFIVIALGSLVLHQLLDGLRLFAMQKMSMGTANFGLSVKTNLLGRYWDNLTPSALGGQPYQMYYLSKHKVPIGVSTSIPLSNFFFQQVAISLIALVALIFNSSLLPSTFMKVATWVGLVLLLLAPTAIQVFTRMPKIATKVVDFFLRMGAKFKIVKNLEAAKTRTYSGVQDYVHSLKSINSSFIGNSLLVLLSLVSAFCNLSISYFVMRACGYMPLWWETCALAAFTWCSTAIVPTPGSSGVAESAFYVIFGAMQGGLLFWGMIMWRFITYYLVVIVGFFLSVGELVARGKEEKLKEQEALQLSSEQEVESSHVNVENAETQEEASEEEEE